MGSWSQQHTLPRLCQGLQRIRSDYLECRVKCRMGLHQILRGNGTVLKYRVGIHCRRNLSTLTRCSGIGLCSCDIYLNFECIVQCYIVFSLMDLH